jgi:hypothetical protein
MQPEQPNTPSTDIQTPDAVTSLKPVPTSSVKGLHQGGGSDCSVATHRGDLDQCRDRRTQTARRRTLKPDRGGVRASKVQAEDRSSRGETGRGREKVPSVSLRDEDPWAYVEEERKEEQVAEQTGVQQFFSNIGTAHDRVSASTPLVEAAPARLSATAFWKLEGAGTGLEGRKLVVTKALESLRNTGVPKAPKKLRCKLRRNTAFRKQVLNEGADNRSSRSSCQVLDRAARAMALFSRPLRTTTTWADSDAELIAGVGPPFKEDQLLAI